MRMTTARVFAGAVAAIAGADNTTDCDGPDPAVGIPARTRLIEAAASEDAVVAAYTARSKHRIFQGDLDAALADIDATLARDSGPSYAQLYQNRGLARLFQERFADAVADLNRAIELEPENPLSFLHRAAARAAQGETDGAVADLRRVLELDPGNAEAADGVRQLGAE